jgi:hypothetical protein
LRQSFAFSAAKKVPARPAEGFKNAIFKIFYFAAFESFG